MGNNYSNDADSAYDEPPPSPPVMTDGYGVNCEGMCTRSKWRVNFQQTHILYPDCFFACFLSFTTENMRVGVVHQITTDDNNHDAATTNGQRREQQQSSQNGTEENSNMDVSVKSYTGFAPPAKSFGKDCVQITDGLADVRIKYHVNSKELGHGHYGVVRKCMNRETSQWYAIKSIRKAKVKKIEVLKREIQILKEVKHPHIIELVDVFEDAKYLHLVTELCTGGELFDRIIAKSQSPEGHYSEHDAASIIRHILDAIAYCHSKGIVHRDLKPEVGWFVRLLRRLAFTLVHADSFASFHPPIPFERTFCF